ncbi:MAG: hypothetical protein FWH17_02475 [Oscillospiraceae bacterium]|nr:hypothetical protein [Oscillospiraceae bacterium]
MIFFKRYSKEHGIEKEWEAGLRPKFAFAREMTPYDLTNVQYLWAHMSHLNDEIIAHYGAMITSEMYSTGVLENNFVRSGDNLPTAADLVNLTSGSIDGNLVNLLPHQAQKDAVTWKVLAPMVEKYHAQAQERLEKYRLLVGNDLGPLEAEERAVAGEIESINASIYELENWDERDESSGIPMTRREREEELRRLRGQLESRTEQYYIAVILAEEIRLAMTLMCLTSSLAA